MRREVYGQNGDNVVVMDVRDLLQGEYTVDVLEGAGYKTIYSSASLGKCITMAKSIERRNRR